MRIACASLVAVVALALGAIVGATAAASLGFALGYALFADDDPETGLPDAVEETRVDLLRAAEAGDYEALRPYLTDNFSYTFGGPAEGGPIAYWKELERTTDERPLETLAAILKMPYVLSRGYYVWPFAYTAESADDLSPHERDLLAPLGPTSQLFPEGVGYLGWRAGIAPDGRWAFYVAGD